MSSSGLFRIANLLAMAGWILLIILTFTDVDTTQGTHLLVAIWAIVLLFSIMYVYLIISGRDAFRDGGYGSLEKVMTLFRHPKATLAGWIHYLAFDLLTASFLFLFNSFYTVDKWLLLPCYALIFLFGPAGFLLYVIFLLIENPGLIF